MAKGRKNTPLKLLKARGSKQARGRVEPEIAGGPVTCPPWVPAAARPWWDEIVELLGPVDVLRRSDRLVLAALCRVIARYLQAEALIDEQGIQIENEVDGTVRRHPLLPVAQACWDQIVRGAREFGLTPSSRASLATAATKKKAGEGKAKFFKVG